jgi:hypothetical protein
MVGAANLLEGEVNLGSYNFGGEDIMLPVD